MVCDLISFQNTLNNLRAKFYSSLHFVSLENVWIRVYVFFYSFIDFNVVVLYSYQVYCVLANWMHSSIVQKHIWIVNRQMWKELKLNCTLVFHSCIHSILVLIHIHFALCVPLQLPYSYACGKLFFRNLFTVIVRTGEVRKLLSIHLIDKVLYTFRIFSLIRSIEMRITFATS